MSYTAAVDHLLALAPELSPTAPRRKFDLEHMRILARALGDPQTKFPSVLIAGTNGKGSTAATLASILTAAGYRTGLYTSPHLSRVTERIRVSDREQGIGNREQRPDSCSLTPVPCSLLLEIPEPDFARLYFHVDSTANRLVAASQLPHHPSFFETLTALAFLYFAEQQLDIAVLEVGLGGRLDATNLVEPVLSVITDIALDHQDYLGNTIAEIAREKAGILRRNGSLITLPQHPEANQAIGEAAIALDVRAISAAAHLPDAVRSTFSVDRSKTAAAPPADNVERRTYTAVPLQPNDYDLHLDGEILHVRSPLAGEHQRRNIAIAIAAAIELLTGPSPLAPTSNLEPRTSNLLQTIEAGIAATSWPGRLEFLPPNLLLDVAHNPAGAWALRAAIAALPEAQSRTLIFSCLRDKDLTEISRILFPLFDVVRSPFSVDRSKATTDNVEPATYNLILTPIDNPRAASLDSLVAAAAALDIPAHTAATPTEALALARSITPSGGLIVATGSIYLVGALREAALTA